MRDGDPLEYNDSVATDGSFSVAGGFVGTYVIILSAGGYQPTQGTSEIVASSNFSLGSVQIFAWHSRLWNCG